MTRTLEFLRALTQVRELGGGSFWRGVLYLIIGLIALLSLPFVALMLLPEWVLLVVFGLLSLAILWVVFYIGVRIVARIRPLLR